MVDSAEEIRATTRNQRQRIVRLMIGATIIALLAIVLTGIDALLVTIPLAVYIVIGVAFLRLLNRERDKALRGTSSRSESLDSST